MIFNALSLAAGAALITGYAALPLGYCVLAGFMGLALSILIDWRIK
jgi:hypothetical protein